MLKIIQQNSIVGLSTIEELPAHIRYYKNCKMSNFHFQYTDNVLKFGYFWRTGLGTGPKFGTSPSFGTIGPVRTGPSANTDYHDTITDGLERLLSLSKPIERSEGCLGINKRAIAL